MLPCKLKHLPVTVAGTSCEDGGATVLMCVETRKGKYKHSTQPPCNLHPHIFSVILTPPLPTPPWLPLPASLPPSSFLPAAAQRPEKAWPSLPRIYTSP